MCVNKLSFCLVLQTKNANVLGFCWTNWNEIVFITDQGIEFYQVIKATLLAVLCPEIQIFGSSFTLKAF